MNRKLALHSIFCFYRLKNQTRRGSCPVEGSKLAMELFSISQRESQAGHCSAGQPGQDNDSIGRGVSSPALPAIPFSWGQQSVRGTTGSGGTSLHAHLLSSLSDLGLGPVLQLSLNLMTGIQPLRWQDLISSQGLHTCSNWYTASLWNCSSQALEEHLI